MQFLDRECELPRGKVREGVIMLRIEPGLYRYHDQVQRRRCWFLATQDAACRADENKD